MSEMLMELCFVVIKPCFHYIGGNDSQDTAAKIDALAKERCYELRVVGVPKTIDNDLPLTDHCPGFGSVAKHIGVTIRETALNNATMGRNANKRINVLCIFFMQILYIMVLFGKLISSETSCLLFKMPAPSADTLNVYMACPLHVLSPNDFKVKIQVLGNDTTRVSTARFITAVLFPVQHPFLDLALGVIQDPEIINNTPELKAISYLSVDESNQNIENSNVDVMYANKSGGVSRIPSRILSMNYELGSQEQNVMTHSLPAPGGFIQVELDAKSGLSGGLVVNRGPNPSILGMIIVSSSTSSNEEDGGDCNLKTSKNLASKMFYIAPHISQCTSRFYRLTLNDPVKLANLCKHQNMQTFRDDAMPEVNHLGGDYANKTEINQMNPYRHLTLMNVHNFLSVSPLALNQENETNSIEIRTAINTNRDFLNYFFSRQENSTVLIRSARYFDKIKNREITLNFEVDEMANILDWCYRGDPLANLVLNCQLRTLNDNGEVSLTPENSVDSFTFLSSETLDRIHNRIYPRRTMQIPGAFFNKLNSFEVLRNFGMDGANIQRLRLRLCTANNANENGSWRGNFVSRGCYHGISNDLGCMQIGNRWMPFRVQQYRGPMGCHRNARMAPNGIPWSQQGLNWQNGQPSEIGQFIKNITEDCSIM